MLGNLLFTLYILPLDNIICRFGLHLHCHAEKVPLYISTKSINTETHSSSINRPPKIKSWMQANFLKVNYDKSDMINIILLYCCFNFDPRFLSHPHLTTAIAFFMVS